MKTVTDEFEKYIGTKEYNGIIADIQRWYYGYVSKTAWCATSMSKFMNNLGLLDQIGGKNENVCEMMWDTERAHIKLGKGRFYQRDDIPTGMQIPRGSIAFMLWYGKMEPGNPGKHVTSVYKAFEWTKSGKFKALGGNQANGINLKEYNIGNIYAIFIPDYEQESDKKKTLRRGDHGDDVVELQMDMNHLGYPDADGSALAIDGSFGRRTEEAVKRLQKHNGLDVDGVCGPKTWAKIEVLLQEKPKMVRILTDVYIRSKPSAKSEAKGIIREGATVVYSFVQDGWLYLPRWNGWITSKKEYVKIV